MGNSYTSPAHCPDERLLDVIQKGNGGLKGLLLRQDIKEEAIIEVDMNYDHSISAWKEHYTITFSDQPPPTSQYYMILLFPCHAEPKKQVLYTYQYSDLTHLNQEINQRLRDSLALSFDFNVTRLAIVYGKVVYCLRNMLGTAYLNWTSSFHATNHNFVSTSNEQHLPMLITMDGYTQFESILVLHPSAPLPGVVVKPLNVNTCRMRIPFRVFLWTDEADPREHKARLDAGVQIVTSQQPPSVMYTRHQQMLTHEPAPFSASEAEQSEELAFRDLDSDDEIESLGSASELFISTSTPRLDTLPHFIGLQSPPPGTPLKPDEH